MKFIVYKDVAVNLAHVAGIGLSNNWLTFTMSDGREVRFVHGTTVELARLFDHIIDFVSSDTVNTCVCDPILGGY